MTTEAKGVLRRIRSVVKVLAVIWTIYATVMWLVGSYWFQEWLGYAVLPMVGLLILNYILPKTDKPEEPTKQEE